VDASLATSLITREVTLGLALLVLLATGGTANSLDDLSIALLLVLAACLPSRVVSDLGVVETAFEANDFGKIFEEPGRSDSDAVGGVAAEISVLVVLLAITAASLDVGVEGDVGRGGNDLSANTALGVRVVGSKIGTALVLGQIVSDLVVSGGVGTAGLGVGVERARTAA